MRVAIMGAGGQGGYYGAMLARAGEDVNFIARGAHLNAIRAHGLTVKTPDGEEFTIDAKATADPGEDRAGGPCHVLRENLRYGGRRTADPIHRRA